MANARDALWADGHDETVEVNQRALIDKVLARYSGEFTVFRELLQNSDDAASHSVEIRFETKEYLDQKKGGKDVTVENVASDGGNTDAEAKDGGKKLPDLKTALVHQWTFKNNGLVFQDEDWNRLKKIAEGNPDEEKIGSFWSRLFSVTEEPFVTSGGQWMGFYWKDKKDQLFARRGQFPSSNDGTPDPWTTFEMTLREPAPIPAAFDFTRFLVSSITFMSHLSQVSVFFDDKRLVRLSKESGSSRDMPLLRGLKTASPSGIMTVRGIQSTPLNIKAEVVRWVYSVGTEKPGPISAKPAKSSQGGFFSSLLSSFAGTSSPARTPTPKPVTIPDPVNLLEITESGVTLSIFTANIEVKLDTKLSTELFRSTKKQMPGKMRYELIYTGKDEYDKSVQAEQKVAFATGSVFQGLRADLDGSGLARVFIGHSTGQTTGIGGHMAARFIPTVERESVDLVDRNVAVWNKELLYIGGFLARSAYELEMTKIKTLWDGAVVSSDPAAKPDAEMQSWLQTRALHSLKFFTFHASTPSSIVSSSLEGGFFTCATSLPFSIMSSEGVRSASDVRIPDAAFQGFLKRLPVIPDDMLSGAKLMIGALQRRGLIKEITFVDVLQEIRNRPLSEPEVIACLKWWIGMATQSHDMNLPQIRTQLLSAAVVAIGTPGTEDERIVALSTIQMFLNTRQMGAHIPIDGPLPGNLLPVSISKAFSPDVLSSIFSWRQLTIMDWLTHVTNPSVMASHAEYDVTRSAPWAERVLMVIARAWQSLAKETQAEVIVLLKTRPLVPTSAGLKLPEQSYFSNVNLFRDLPIVILPSGTPIRGPLEKVLQVLGVRRHVDLQIVFDRMIKTGDWTIIDLVKYLTTVQATLTYLERDRLRHTNAFTKEENQVTGKSRSPAKVLRYKASDLYEPLDTFRNLKLPIIDWGKDNKWKPSSEEAKFLYSLGLKRQPPIRELIELAAGVDPVLKSKALNYLLENFVAKYAAEYDPDEFGSYAFIPALKAEQRCMAKPSDVYAHTEWMAMGFIVVQQELVGDSATKLKIPQHPPTFRLVALLQRTPPKDEAEARQWFEIIATRIPEFSPDELRKLTGLPFVPTKVPGTKDHIRLLCPNQCYFAGSSKADFHSKLFVFVDFGSRANSFLSACGTKREPSVEEIVLILLKDPKDFYKLAGGPERRVNSIAISSYYSPWFVHE
ncbi:hypothetical protein EW146_g8508 [Bondarzewia mesenterica]|uniref:Uncharacterized protein n=1 Tax=Bondarzewia mesenterica TaxID=1095465 RepID=A0A4S4LE44_9AGAM|nr:hypothetical protein EW146_g8508 [Bondarzewia mesenterica]